MYKKHSFLKIPIFNLFLLTVVIILTAAPLFVLQGAEFTGTDDQAKKVIGELNAGYQPWFSSLWEPPGKEIESLLFVLQAAVGAGFIGYYIGFARGKRDAEKQ